MSDRLRYALLALCFIAAVAASYGLASAGEPSSAWLWSQLLGRPVFNPIKDNHVGLFEFGKLSGVGPRDRQSTLNFTLFARPKFRQVGDLDFSADGHPASLPQVAA